MKTSEENRRLALLRVANLPDTGDEKTIANYDTEKGSEEVLQAALDFLSGIIISLALIGPTDTGKTHIAQGLCHEYLDLHIPVRFIVANILLMDLKACFDKGAQSTYSDLFNRVATVPLLVLDDFYQGSMTAWGVATMEDIVAARHSSKLSTIFTSNASLDEMSERIRSRLQREEWCRVVNTTPKTNIPQGINEVKDAQVG